MIEVIEVFTVEINQRERLVKVVSWLNPHTDEVQDCTVYIDGVLEASATSRDSALAKAYSKQ